MNPDWMIDKDDCVCSSCTLFDLIPRAEPVNEPSVALMHCLDCLPQLVFCCTRPPCLVLYRIDLSKWQIIVLGNPVCQRGLSATTVPDNHHSVHRDRHSLHSASTVAATLLFLCNTGPPNVLRISRLPCGDHINRSGRDLPKSLALKTPWQGRSATCACWTAAPHPDCGDLYLATHP